MTCSLVFHSTPLAYVTFHNDPVGSLLVDCSTQIAVIGHIYNLDLHTRGLSISWILAGCGDYRLPSFAGHYGRPYTTCAPPDRPVDVYFDGLLMVASLHR